MGKDVSIATAGSPQIELRLAGTFGVIRGGTELPESEVDSRKSRTLLKLLAVERPALVPVDRIVDVLWAGESPAAAEQNVATLVSRLRGVLGSGIIVGGRHGYRLAGEQRVGVDLDAAARCCERAERKLPASPAIALAAAERTMGLLSADIALAGELGADPAPQTQELHLAILREQDRDRAAWHQARSAHPDGSVQRSRPGQRDRRRRMLAGRDREAGALREAWDRAVAGGSGLVMIVGEAGIGKTALAEDLAADVDTDGAMVLRTRCYEAERSLFLQPVAEAVAPIVSRMPASALQQLLGEHAPALAALLPEAAALLGPSPPWHGSPEMERRRSFQAVTAFLAGLADRSPLLLVVDDLQYAGQSTVEFLHYLGRQASGSRLLTVVTVRAEHDAEIGSALAPTASRIEVGPLSAAAVEQLATQAGQGALAKPILLRRRGHTLFVVEVLRALAAGDTGVPESLRSAVQARVRRTGAAAESLLRAASVLGAAIDPLTLGELLELTPAAAVDLCEQAFQARLLVVSGRDYEFANDLIREVLYATTPEPTRLAYHRRAADLLTGQPEALARHATAAGDWLRAARAWLLAAEDAMRRSATSDAITLSSQALEAAERGGDTQAHARALILRGRAREAAGAHVSALTDLTLGAADARAAGDRRLEMLALRELGGDVPASRGLPISFYVSNLERGLRIAESTGDRATEADLLGRLAIIAANRLRLDVALDYGLRAVAAARASADEHALAAGLDGLKIAYLSLGDVQGLAGVLAELDPLLRSLGDLFRLQWAEFESAFPLIAAAKWDKATTAMETALEANRRGGYPHCAVWYTAHLGWLARLRGHDDDAMALGQRSLAMTEQLEHTWWKPAACAIFGLTLLQRGDQAGAVEVLERGLAVAEQAGVEAYLLRCAAPLAAATGSPSILARADRLLEQATIPAGGAWLLGEESYLCLAQAWLEQDDAERARAVLSPLLTVADREPWTPTLAATLALDRRALLRLGESDQARAQLLRAERIAAEHGLPHVRQDARSALHSVR